MLSSGSRARRRSIVAATATLLLLNGCATHAPVRSAADLAEFHRRTEDATLQVIKNDGSVEKVHEVHVADGFLRGRRHDATDEVRVPISEIRIVRQRAANAGFLFYGLLGGIAGFVAGRTVGESSVESTNNALRGVAILGYALGGAVAGVLAGGAVGSRIGVPVNHDLSEYHPEMDETPGD